MICSVCLAGPAVINRLFAPFIDKRFGAIDDQSFVLCTECDFLFNSGYLARLTDVLCDATKKSGQSVFSGDIYTFLRSMKLATEVRAN